VVLRFPGIEGQSIRRFVIDLSQPSQFAGEAHPHIQFGNDPELDANLRGRRLPHKQIKRVRPVTILPGDRILAKYEEVPVWAVRATPDGLVDLVSMTFPAVGADETLVDYFHGTEFIRLLPLLQYLKRTVANLGWRGPELRASFMFDDPNLHWKSYGYVSYPEIIRSAERHGYHVSFATVPLDGWYANGRTAALFRESAKQVSLLIHGNDHLHAELGERRDDARTSRHHGAGAPPHRPDGAERANSRRASSSPATRRMLGGDDAEHARAGNRRSIYFPVVAARLERTRGMAVRSWDFLPAEVIATGLQWRPAFRIGEECEGSVAIAAFLGRPIVPVGHHDDSESSGVELLEEIAGQSTPFP
jgi:hypothetical protein